ncbi:MAG: hypothetical protein J7L19_02260 [Dehalococcoidia bacterium]|nr:hypothetical protein [Dehalococcoidia bacterium]
MDYVELLPSLSHCIETVAREKFWNLVNKCMENAQENKEMGSNIELLKAFLESMDFKKLRRESEEYLTQGRAVKFTVYWKAGKPSYNMIVS